MTLNECIEKERSWVKGSGGFSFFPSEGTVLEVQAASIISKGPRVHVGDICEIEGGFLCEVMGIKQGEVTMVPFDANAQISVGAKVKPREKCVTVPGLSELKGKVLNGNGEVISGERFFSSGQEVNLDPPPTSSMDRERIRESLVSGVKAIDGFMTMGRGQKIGIFSGSGVGKSTLLGMIAKNSEADVNVIALVGERGREVKEFVENELGEEGLKRSVVVVATSDESSLMQVRASKLATAIAECFRTKEQHVLLMMDSITRFSEARKQIDMLNGYYPIGGKTVTMEEELKQLLERSGPVGNGSITGIYTVLVDGDDMNSPIPDLARGILDGHIALDRNLAEQAHYPAISVPKSISRVMKDVASEEHQRMANELRRIMTLFLENEDYFKTGMLVEGEDTKEIFGAKKKYPQVMEFLKQHIHESRELSDTLESMGGLVKRSS